MVFYDRPILVGLSLPTLGEFKRFQIPKREWKRFFLATQFTT